MQSMEMVQGGEVAAARLYPFVTFRTHLGFLSGHRLMGQCQEIFDIELSTSKEVSTHQYNEITTLYDRHKRLVEPIARRIEEDIHLPRRLARHKENFKSYLRIAGKLP